MTQATLDDRRARRRDEVDDFLRRWHTFVRAWRQAARRGVQEALDLVEGALRDGLPPAGDAPAPDRETEFSAARAVVAATGLLDPEEYARRHDVRRGEDPVRRFVTDGWRALENPSPRFDLWSYWVDHLDPTDDRVNPVLHHALVGRHRGLQPVPSPSQRREPVKVGGSVRRVCLFAAHDRDGLVDDYVVTYLAELSRHADIYYLADGVLEPGQLARLAGITAGAWSIPHGAYDFGSFSLLARDLVGWDVIDTYDELLLANDSCFLLRPLDEVFATMGEREADWWSLQATSMEHDENYFRDDAPIPLEEAKRRFVGPRKWKDVHYLHLSSYFLAFRRPVISDPGFRWRLDTVVPQADKSLVVLKYEVGISRYLTDAGFDFDTWLGDLHAFHPLYSREVFGLLAGGFPLVKRNFLGENPRRAPGVDAWPEKLEALAPVTDIGVMVDNVRRITEPARLHDAYDVSQDPLTGRRRVPTHPVSGYGLRRLDKETPTFPHWWGFVAGPGGRLDPGQRAVLETVRHDPTVRKVILTRRRSLVDDVSGVDVRVVPFHAHAGQEAFARCGVVLLGHAPAQVLVPESLVSATRRFVHVGIGTDGTGEPPRPTDSSGDWAMLAGLAVATRDEALLRAATLPGVGLERTWSVGLPRHDLLVAERLPPDLAAAEDALRSRLAGRPLVVWWPADGSVASYDQDVVSELAGWAERHDVVVGVRESAVDRLDGYTHALQRTAPLGLGDRSVSCSTLVHRVATAVVTDHAPEAFDARLLGRPVLTEDDPAALLTQLEGLAADGFARTGEDPGLPAPDRLAARRLVHRIRLTG